eukprot:3636919-Rhodomonas_salina.1
MPVCAYACVCACIQLPYRAPSVSQLSDPPLNLNPTRWPAPCASALRLPSLPGHPETNFGLLFNMPEIRSRVGGWTRVATENARAFRAGAVRSQTRAAVRRGRRVLLRLGGALHPRAHASEVSHHAALYSLSRHPLSTTPPGSLCQPPPPSDTLTLAHSQDHLPLPLSLRVYEDRVAYGMCGTEIGHLETMGGGVTSCSTRSGRLAGDVPHHPPFVPHGVVHHSGVQHQEMHGVAHLQMLHHQVARATSNALTPWYVTALPSRRRAGGTQKEVGN